jgi:hypothetical protein
MTNFVSRVAVLLFAALIAIPLLAEGTHVRMVNGTVVAFSDGGDAASYDRVRMGGREVTLTLVNLVPYATMRNGKLDGSATWNAGVPPAGPAASRRRLGGYYNARIGNETGFSRHLYGDAMDIYVDQNGDGHMDDINRDGRVDTNDARFLLGPRERGATAHTCGDARGYVARWGAIEESAAQPQMWGGLQPAETPSR